MWLCEWCERKEIDREKKKCYIDNFCKWSVT